MCSVCVCYVCSVSRVWSKLCACVLCLCSVCSGRACVLCVGVIAVCVGDSGIRICRGLRWFEGICRVSQDLPRFANSLRVCQLFACANCVHKHLPGCVLSEFRKTGMFMIFVSFD